MSRKVDIAKFSFIRSFKIKHWQYLPFPLPFSKKQNMLKSNWIFSALDQGGERGSLHRIHCPLYEGSVVEEENLYDFLLDLVGKGT